MKVDVEPLGYNNLFWDFKFMKNVLKIVMDVWWNNRKKENLKKRQYEHKCDIRLGNSNHALSLNISKTNPNFNFNAATILAHIHNKRLGQIF